MYTFEIDDPFCVEKSIRLVRFKEPGATLGKRGSVIGSLFPQPIGGATGLCKLSS